jgi:LmbE family N-acetylglucosaminyl deacetylase
MKRILVISPHPDDETLGCGGTLLRYKKMGSRIFWMNIADRREEYEFSKQEVIQGEKETETVRSMYDFDKFINLSLRPMFLDTYPLNEIISEVSGVINSVKPDTVILPFSGDTHSDHRVVFQAAYPCTKVFRYPFIKRILMMEIISETDFAPPVSGSCFIPNYFVDISEFIDKKLEIMKKYKGEMGAHPFPRSGKNIRALAVQRGAQSGCKYAEGFMLLKAVE